MYRPVVCCLLILCRFWANHTKVKLAELRGQAPPDKHDLLSLPFYTGFSTWHAHHAARRAQWKRVSRHMKRFSMRRIMQLLALRAQRALKIKSAFSGYHYYDPEELPRDGMLAFKCALMSARQEQRQKRDYLLAWNDYARSLINLK